MFGALLKLLREILVTDKAILKVLRLRMPGLVFLRIVSEGDDGMLKFVFDLPPAGATDVVERTLIVKVGDADPVTSTLEGSAIVSAEFSGDQGAVVIGSLADTDDAGNVSPAREFTFELTDTLPPPQPGEVGIRVTEEV